MRVSTVLMSMLLVSGISIAREKVYQWTDENGVTTFSSSPPPPGVVAIERQLDSIPEPNTQTSVSKPEQEKALTPRQNAMKDRDDLARERIKTSSYEEALAIECDRAESVVEKLLSPELIQIAAPNGEIRVMDNNERQERISQAYKFIRDECR